MSGRIFRASINVAASGFCLLVVVGFGATAEELTPREASSMPGPANNQSIQEQIELLLGRDDHIGNPSYVYVTRRADASIVPALRELLSDPAYKNRWGKIAPMLA